MNFHYEELILWLHNGKKRRLHFEPNKVNVITGESNRGKSAILEILDYCFFSSETKISESMINENVAWYGIKFHINDKKFTIARGSVTNRIVSSKYYFSSSGESPDMLFVNSDEKTIKAIMETEFGIDRNATMPFGGSYLSAGSKISLRYFLIFTTISQNIITNDSVFFDKQNEDRYREALPRIFDLAVAIDNVENILAKENKERLEAEIRAIEKRQSRVQHKSEEFEQELNFIIQQAKTFSLVNSDLSVKDSLDALKDVIKGIISENVNEASYRFNQLKSREFETNRTLRNLNQLRLDYDQYKKSLTNIEDSLKPIKFLNQRNSELIKTSIYGDLIAIIQNDLSNLKKDIKSDAPIDININDLIEEQKKNLKSLKDELASIPEISKSFDTDKNKYLFLGEVKAKLNLYEKQPLLIPSSNQNLSQLQQELSDIYIRDVSDARTMFVKVLEEIIKEYMDSVGGVLENYRDYLPTFDYKNKSLLLRKPFTDFAENVGSSSNHMFLHLFLFLGLHEAIIRRKSTFVPSYLVIDQPSRPYWGDNKEEWSSVDTNDRSKIRKAFELLNNFIDRIKSLPDSNFQMIVFEHVPQTLWEGLENIHLVELFSDGNALIPDSYLE